MENAFRDEKNIFNLQLDEQSKAHLLEAARWAKFVAIVLFVMLGLLIVGGAFLGAALSSVSSAYSTDSAILGVIGGTGIALLYILIAAIYFYPTYALLKFSTRIKPAILSANQALFNSALGYLKGMFKYIGILIIIIIALYALVIIFAALAGGG